MALADRVKQLRNEHGWSQGELAETVGADPAQISRYENGRMTPSAEAVVKIAEVLDVTTDYLLVETSPRRSPHAPENILGDGAPSSPNSPTTTSPSSAASSTASSPKPASAPSPAGSAEAAQRGPKTCCSVSQKNEPKSGATTSRLSPSWDWPATHTATGHSPSGPVRDASST